jgi:F-type H+-transporting ATPase subunit epsilon
MASRELNVDLVAADRQIWSGTAAQVIAKTTVGEIGLLSGHEPMLAILVPGTIRITTGEGQLIAAQSDEGGFLSLENNNLTLVVRDATLVS